MPLCGASPCLLQFLGAQSKPWRLVPGSAACPTAVPDADLILPLLCVLQSVRARYQLPLGAVIHPLADPQDVPVVNLGSAGIVRCRMCRTYINPFVQWIDSGRCGTEMAAGCAWRVRLLPWCLPHSSLATSSVRVWWQQLGKYPQHSSITRGQPPVPTLRCTSTLHADLCVASADAIALLQFASSTGTVCRALTKVVLQAICLGY